MTYYPSRKTPMTSAQVAEALLPALRSLGRPVTTTALAIALGHIDFETAGFVQIRLWNFGNHKVSTRRPLDEQDFQCFACSEVLGGKEVFFVPEGQLTAKGGAVIESTRCPVPDGHPQTRFRAFSSPEEGARGWLDLLRGRYPEALEAMQAGLPDAFSKCLKNRGYYTASESIYTAGVVRRSAKHMATALAALKVGP